MSAEIVTRTDQTFGSWCVFCGDYYHGMTRFDAMLTGTRGCQRCVREGASVRLQGAKTEDIVFDGIIFDCEIERGVRPKKQQPQLGIEYSNGWQDFRGMGISVIGAYDYVENIYRVFCKDNFDEFKKLIHTRKWVVGFNSRGFDEPLVRVHGCAVPEAKSYDILVEVWRAAGLPLEFTPHLHRGYGLGPLCTANFDVAKSGDGALAPVLWQQGKIGTVIDYCLHDVWLTKRLMDRVLTEGVLSSPKGLGRLDILKPGSETRR